MSAVIITPVSALAVCNQCSALAVTRVLLALEVHLGVRGLGPIAPSWRQSYQVDPLLGIIYTVTDFCMKNQCSDMVSGVGRVNERFSREREPETHIVIPFERKVPLASLGQHSQR